MAVFFNETTKKWYCKFYYTDYKGNKKQKKKSGFKLKREAKDWETEFLSKQQEDVDMLFSSFLELYFEDMSHRLRETTVSNKKFMINAKILPFFGKLKLSEIKSTHVRKWQNQLIAYTDQNGKHYTETYIKTLNNQLVAIFNYAVKYYDLKENPCTKAGTVGKKHAEEMEFYTLEEFNKFIAAINEHDIQSRTIFTTLYWTGMRIGELLALTAKDIDLESNTININKSLQRLEGKDIITPPKTPKSKRVINIPVRLNECLTIYLKGLYGLKSNHRIFTYNRQHLRRVLHNASIQAEVKEIRLHDFRHSHASLLIELGCSPLLIAERLGHEKVETTLNTYSHLYPSKQEEIVSKMDNL